MKYKYIYYVPYERNRRNKKKNNEKVAAPSEFDNSGYDQVNISKVIRRLLWEAVHDVRLPNAYFDGFNQMLASSKKKENLIIDRDSITRDVKMLSSIDYLDSTEQKGEINVKEYRAKYYNQLCNLVLSWDNKFYSKKIADAYLDAFYELTRKCIFSSNNYNLSNSTFRKSKFLKGIILLGAKEKTLNEEEGRKYYSCSLINPFSYDTTQRAINCAIDLGKKLSRSRQNEMMNSLRINLLLDSIQSAYKRFAYVDGETYHFELNRHDSSLTAIPYDELSSIEAIKPIRLFEKIAAYIRNNFRNNRDSIYRVNICIIGHTEASGKEERELCDLASAILTWYDSLEISNDLSTKPNLNLHIRNLINLYDEAAARQRDGLDGVCITLGAHKVGFCVEPISYLQNFAFNTRKINEIIKKNQLTFIIDCPFLTTENFEIKNISSLNYFSQSLNNRSRDNGIQSEDDDTYRSYLKFSPIKAVDAQLDRIMASNTQDAGEVVRVVKAKLLTKIEEYVASFAKEQEEKYCYIFTSERDAVGYSYMATYPLTRCERYDGKAFSIINYSNRRHQGLKCNSTKTDKFRIRLWSILKYISISCAYLDFKRVIDECLDPDTVGSIDYFTLFRSILLEGEVDSYMSNIVFKLGFSNKIDYCFGEDIPNDSLASLKSKILATVQEFIENAYLNCIFPRHNQRRFKAIQTAFSMNLYSAAENVNTMLFWHKYRIASSHENFDSFHVRFKRRSSVEPIFSEEDEFLDVDFFSDKKIYDYLLDSLQHTSELNLNTSVMLYDSCVLFQDEKYARTAVKNIITVCEKAGDRNSRIYQNACYLLQHN